jgi:formiminotetrahydrofolate cyclodeaminase
MTLAEKAVLMGNKNTVTDGAVAALMARAAVISAVYNVKINLNAITDEELKTEMRHQADEIVKEAEEKEKVILSKIDL